MNKIRTVSETLAILRQNHHPVGIERQPNQLKTSDFGGKVIFSNDPRAATVPPAFFTVQTIQELKALGGIPDSEYGPGRMEPHHPLPEPFSAERLADVTGSHIDLCKAFRAYIYGNSALVKDYEEMLNAKRFPMKVALYNGERITITSDNPLIIKDENDYGEPVVLVYDEIVIEPGGQIVYHTNGRIEANTLVGNGNAGNENIVNKGSNGVNGFDGAPGYNGANGSNGSPGQDSKNGCLFSATPGTDGSRGSTGAIGGDGAAAGNANDLTMSVQSITGVISAATVGGNGGNGGKGGNGGHGGVGGNGGNWGDGTIRWCPDEDAGNGGDGGNGGNGGHGGKGGDSGNIYINFSEGDPKLSVVSLNGLGGEGGMVGWGGVGGRPGHSLKAVGRYGRHGENGRDGARGEFGDDGITGKIYVNGHERKP
ncbi:hypothetical protein [Photorhabdus asymbiotica]|uniref:hypothetical protein n=1 Tax=Photorhabdus asymbiotica TaxID=291112 RepID=UPI003DA77F57